MRFTTVAASLASVGAALAQSAPTINTPTALYQCQPYLVSWNGGTAPYRVRVLPGGQLSGTVLANLDDQPTSDTSYTWTVGLPEGTSITLTVTDSTGVTAASAPVTIGAGDDSCLAAGSSSASQASSSFSASSTAASSAVSSSSSAPASSSASSVSSSVSSRASSVSSSVSSQASTVSSAASSAVSSVSSAVSSRVSSATGSAPSATQSPTSGAGAIKAGSALALVAGAVVAFAA
ncbi:hypothetical protein JCM10213_005870 [Rhodosporidiobolus nylandii]